MTGVYSIAEVVDDSNKRPNKTVFYFIEENPALFTKHQLKSLEQVGKMVRANGGTWCETEKELLTVLNS